MVFTFLYCLLIILRVPWIFIGPTPKIQKDYRNHENFWIDRAVPARQLASTLYIGIDI